MSKKKTSQNIQNLHKKEQFIALLHQIEEGKIPSTWELIAEAIGVHRQTIYEWKKLPQFKEALAKGIQNSLSRMERAGARDWRMWREKYALLSKETKKTEDNSVKVIAILGGVSVPGSNSDEKVIEAEETN